MTYNHTMLYLAFLGFTDPHTSIEKYYATIGTSYSLNDLIEVNFLHVVCDILRPCVFSSMFQGPLPLTK